MIASEDQKQSVDNELMKVIERLSYAKNDNKQLDDMCISAGIQKVDVDEMLKEYVNAVEDFRAQMQEPYKQAQNAFKELKEQLSKITAHSDATKFMAELRYNPMFNCLSADKKCDVLKAHFKRRHAETIMDIKDDFNSLKKTKKLPEEAVCKLKTWWHTNIMWPYPSVSLIYAQRLSKHSSFPIDIIISIFLPSQYFMSLPATG